MARRRDPPLCDRACTPRDSVDRLIADWRRVRPDLDFAPVGVITRLGRVRAHVDRELDGVFAAHGVGSATFAVLVTLARLAAPGGVSQRRLAEELGLTSGTVSVRIDRLVADGLVERGHDPDDRRGSLVRPTARGGEVLERLLPAHLDNERRLLAALTPAERDLLADLLRRLLVEFEGSAPPPGTPVRLGLVLAPAHVTVAMRAAVGLPGVTGLLVRGLDDDGPAAAAGVRVGDVLVRAGGRDVASVANLHGALAAAGPGGLSVQVVRGVERVALTLHLPPAGDAGPPESAGRAAADHHRV